MDTQEVERIRALWEVWATGANWLDKRNELQALASAVPELLRILDRQQAVIEAAGEAVDLSAVFISVFIESEMWAHEHRNDRPLRLSAERRSAAAAAMDKLVAGVRELDALAALEGADGGETT